MKFYDANCVIGKPSTKTPFAFETPEDLLRSMDCFGIEKAIVSTFKERNSGAWTDSADKMEMIELLKPYEERLVPCQTIKIDAQTFAYDDIRYIRDILNNGVRTFKLIIDDRAPVATWCFDGIAKELTENGACLFVDVLAEGGAISHTPATPESWRKLFDLASSFPDLPIIVFSPKSSIQQHYCMHLLRHCANVRLDISGFQFWCCLELMVERFGAEKLIFGSYSPFFEPGQFMLEIVYAKIAEKEREQIAWRNLSDLL